MAVGGCRPNLRNLFSVAVTMRYSFLASLCNGNGGFPPTKKILTFTVEVTSIRIF